MSSPALPQPPPEEAPPEEAPLSPDALGRGAALVPLDSASGRALAAVIAILTFLAALAAGMAELVASASAGWQDSLGREATIQVRPVPGRDVEADLARAADLARQTPGIREARIIAREEGERLVEPWLGQGLDLAGLPVPRLVVLVRAPDARPDLGALRRALAEAVPRATLDDHQVWLRRLSTMAGTVVAVGAGIVALVLAAAGLAVAFATRGAMAGNREVVEVLHLVGATDAFIAGEFQRRFLLLGLRGGAVGAAAALAALALLGSLSGLWRASPEGDQIEALFGSAGIGWRGILAAALIAGVVSGVAAVVSRRTVRRYLADAG